MLSGPWAVTRQRVLLELFHKTGTGSQVRHAIGGGRYSVARICASIRDDLGCPRFVCRHGV